MDDRAAPVAEVAEQRSSGSAVAEDSIFHYGLTRVNGRGRNF